MTPEVGSRWRAHARRPGADVVHVVGVDAPDDLPRCVTLRDDRGTERWVLSAFLATHSLLLAPHEPPRVVCGRWVPGGEEWSVAPGFRVQTKVTRSMWVVNSFRLATGGGVEVVLSRAEPYQFPTRVVRAVDVFFSLFEPAPPESRWLDPASVPAGAPIRVCSKDCPFPSRQPSGSGALCAYCASTRYAVSPGVPPSALSPAPRWRVLQGMKWNSHPPRVKRTIPIDVVDRKTCVWRVSQVPGDVLPRRARKVRDVQVDPGTYPPCGSAKWVLA